MRAKHLLYVTTSISLGIAAPALAQQPVSPPSGETVLGDVIVTARRVEERLQDVPISMTVFNQEQLQERNVFSARDLATYTPSLSANARFGSENASFAIRGFQQELRTTASVAVYFADVVAPRGGGSTTAGDGAGPGYFFDLQNVQVLKGPQGTLFGRNTTGGAILLVPQRPTNDFEGYFEASFGNYEMRRLQGVVNIPLNDKLRLRLAGDTQQREGYLNNISPIGPRDFSDIDYVAFRASLVADLADNLENYTIFSYSRSENNGHVPKVVACSPNAVPAGPLACQQVARLQGRGDLAIESSEPDPLSFMEQWQLINTTTWEVNDNLTVKNIASYAELTNRGYNDAFGTYWPIPATFLGRPTGALAGSVSAFVPIRSAPGMNSNEQSTFSEELQVQGQSLGERLVWQAGAYYEESKPLARYGNQNGSFISCTDSASLQCTDVFGRLLGREGQVGSISRQIAQTAFQNVGLYAQASFDLTEQLKLTAGYRYTWDRTKSDAQKIVYRFPAANDPRMYCLDPAVGPNGPVRVGGALSYNNSIPLGLVDTACLQTYSQRSDAPTWTIGLDYKPTDNILLYGKYSRGYRQGSTNPFGANGFETFRSEQVDTYELGAKTSWGGPVRGTFNIAGYYNDFTDQQVQVGFRSTTNAIAPNTGIVNAGKSRIYGLEIESTISPYEGLTLSASYGYLETELQEISPISIPTGSLYNAVIPTSVAGRPLIYSPKNKVSLTAAYRLPLDESIGDVTASLTYSHSSSMYTSFQTSAGRVPPVDLVSANLSWENIGGRPIDASLFATNLLDERYIYAVNDQTSSGFVSTFLGEPRMYGARIRVRFGQ